MESKIFLGYLMLKLVIFSKPCLSILGTHMTVNNFTNNNAVFFFVSNEKIVYYNNY